MRLNILTLAILATILAEASACALEVIGRPTISDADTVRLSGHKIRLLDMDAPETDQFCLDSGGDPWNCGLAARAALIEHAGDKVWKCEGKKRDVFKRLLASCIVEGENISQWMVKAGWAMSPARKSYSHQFDSDEKAARDNQSGLWVGAFIAPWDWRRRNCKTEVRGARATPIDSQRKLCGSPSQPIDPACTIKANFSKGKCIYHLEGGQYYGKLDMSKTGRRWFCSQPEAEAANCRPAAR